MAWTVSVVTIVPKVGNGYKRRPETIRLKVAAVRCCFDSGRWCP